MKRAIAASCFALACLPRFAHAGDDDDGTSPALPPLPAPAEPTPPVRRGPADTPPVTTEAAASGDASSEAPPADGREEEPPRFHRLAWSVEGGYAHDVLFGIPINSGSLSLVITANFRQVSVGGYVDGSYGSTVDGLRTLTATYGPLVEGHFGLLRLGAGVRLGLLAINRATESDSLVSTSLGVMARATVDVLGADSSEGLFLVGKATVDCVGTPPLYGVMLGVGVRFLRL